MSTTRIIPTRTVATRKNQTDAFRGPLTSNFRPKALLSSKCVKKTQAASSKVVLLRNVCIVA